MSIQVDSEVDYHEIIGGPVTSKGHVVKYLGTVCEQPVAWITGKSGCVAIAALSEASFTCPLCGAVSYNENDIKHRYCGRCHDFTEEAP